MKIDRKDSETIMKLVAPFTLGIFLALVLEDMWDTLELPQQIGILFLLVISVILVYRKMIWEILR